MTINPTNFVKHADYNKTKVDSVNTEKKSTNLSRVVTEELETGDRGKTLFNTSVKNVVQDPQPQYSSKAPVVKTQDSFKSMLEKVRNVNETSVINNEIDVIDANIIIEEAVNITPGERESNIGKGFYITVSSEHMEKLNAYSKTKNTLAGLQKYNQDKKFKSGILVDLVI